MQALTGGGETDNPFFIANRNLSADKTNSYEANLPLTIILPNGSRLREGLV
jgi:hypothetical protein